MTKWEVHYTKVVEADDFFEAVDCVKELDNDIESVISVCPFIEEEYIPEMK